MQLVEQVVICMQTRKALLLMLIVLKNDNNWILFQYSAYQVIYHDIAHNKPSVYDYDHRNLNKAK